MPDSQADGESQEHGRSDGGPLEHGRSDGGPLWHGRFEGGPAAELWEYTLSLDYDQRLAPFDVAASKEHVVGLGIAGILTDSEVSVVLSALDTTGAELASGEFDFVETDEDIHTAIERRVTAIAGDAGAKLHTARSRNDQVATAFRLWTKSALNAVVQRLLEFSEVLISRAEEAGAGPNAPYLPGYTHLQQAQPVLLAHHLLAHFWSLTRDIERLNQTIERLDVSPLGAGALAGSSLPIDPLATSQRLGFAAVFENSLDAVSDRDFVAEALFDLTMVGLHLSRMGEEIVIWSTEEFGFVRLDDQYSTGSSMLPQKKNPDIAELARGKAGRLIGNLTGLLATLKALPLAYNRDLQEDKEPLFDSFDQIFRALGAFSGMYGTLVFRTDKMAQSADSPYAAATDLAEWLVAKGTPFRDAHAIVGEVVRRSIDGGDDLSELVRTHPKLGTEAAALIEPGVPVSRRTTRGGAGHGPVSEQLKIARNVLGKLVASSE